MPVQLDLKSELTDEERDFMRLSFLTFQDAAQANGIDAEKVALFAIIEGADLLSEVCNPLLTLNVLKLIASDLVAAQKKRQNS
jgi:hypothetical protein